MKASLQENILNNGELFGVENTNLMVEFTILGDNLNPQEVTEILNIQPQKQWVKGDGIPRKEYKRKDSCWVISTGYEESLDINVQISKVVKLIEQKIIHLRRLKEVYNLEFIFSIVVNIENNQKPAMYFNRELLEFVNQINAEIDIDLYIFS